MASCRGLSTVSGARSAYLNERQEVGTSCLSFGLGKSAVALAFRCWTVCLGYKVVSRTFLSKEWAKAAIESPVGQAQKWRRSAILEVMDVVVLSRSFLMSVH